MSTYLLSFVSTVPITYGVTSIIVTTPIPFYLLTIHLHLCIPHSHQSICPYPLLLRVFYSQICFYSLYSLQLGYFPLLFCNSFLVCHFIKTLTKSMINSIGWQKLTSHQTCLNETNCRTTNSLQTLILLF